MGAETLMIVAGVLILVMGSGLAYLTVRRLKRVRSKDDERLAKLSDELMEKLESKSLTPAQKAKIADAIKGVKGVRSE